MRARLGAVRLGEHLADGRVRAEVGVEDEEPSTYRSTSTGVAAPTMAHSWRSHSRTGPAESAGSSIPLCTT